MEAWLFHGNIMIVTRVIIRALNMQTNQAGTWVQGFPRDQGFSDHKQDHKQESPNPRCLLPAHSKHAMIDCHSHLYTPQFLSEDIPGLLQAAQGAGVAAIVVVPESLQDCHQVLQLSTQQPLVQPCAGLHPVQPVHGPDQPYSSCRSVRELSEVQPVLGFIRQHADQLVSSGVGWGSCEFCCRHTHTCVCVSPLTLTLCRLA